VFPIEVASLRNRNEDIPLLAATFMAPTRKKLNYTGKRINPGRSSEMAKQSLAGKLVETSKHC